MACQPPLAHSTQRTMQNNARAAATSSKNVSHSSQRSTMVHFKRSAVIWHDGLAGERIPLPLHPSHLGCIWGSPKDLRQVIRQCAKFSRLARSSHLVEGTPVPLRPQVSI